MQKQDTSFEFPTPIDGLVAGGFRVGGQKVAGPIIMTATLLRPWQGVADVAAFNDLVESLDLILVGTGPETTYLPQSLGQWFDGHGLGVEPMTTPSACRTFNVLLSEGRRVAAALIPL